MPYNKPMDPVQARAYFDLSVVKSGTLPETVLAELRNSREGFRRVQHEGFLLCGEHINGCGDQDGRERYCVVIDDLSKGIPGWLEEISYTVCIHETGGFKIPVSIRLTPCRGNNTLDIVGESNWKLAFRAHQALSSLVDHSETGEE